MLSFLPIKNLLICLGMAFLMVCCEAPPNSAPTTGVTTSIHEHALNPQETTVNMYRQRLLDSYALYWPMITPEYQHEQLPAVLSDPLPELRAFGIERVAVLLRDGDASDEELQLVVDHLRDSSPIVRLAAAKLLPEINLPGLPEYVANSLSVESSKEVIKEELSFFRTKPSVQAIEPTVALLAMESLDEAADTLIVLLETNQISQDMENRIVKTVQKTRRLNDNPSLITLEAMLGNAQVQRNLIHLLQHPNQQVRIAVAQGFASSGYASPLIERASNPELYEYALIALQQRVNIEAFKQLMELYVPDNELWQQAAFGIAIALDTSSLLRADDMLKRMGLEQLRLSILNAVWASAQQKSLAARKAIARRTVPLLISTGDAMGALQLLDVFGESLVDEDLLTLRFSAAISASAWDAAADARPMPRPWIEAWRILRENDPTAAAVVLQQITLRFGDQLTEVQKEELGVVEVDSTHVEESS